MELSTPVQGLPGTKSSHRLSLELDLIDAGAMIDADGPEGRYLLENCGR
jgi:hypothetical protein